MSLRRRFRDTVLRCSDTCAEAVALYCRLVGARVRAQLQYRTSFVLDVVGAFGGSGLDFAAVLIIFHNVGRLAGWSIAEVSLLYALSTLSFALVDLVIGHLDDLALLVRDGSFDLLLIRPRGVLFRW